MSRMRINKGNLDKPKPSTANKHYWFHLPYQHLHSHYHDEASIVILFLPMEFIQFDGFVLRNNLIHDDDFHWSLNEVSLYVMLDNQLWVLSHYAMDLPLMIISD